MASFREIVHRRRSVRGFLPDRAVPKAVIERALALAQQSPSNCNAQPWEIFLVGGNRCQRLRRALLEAANRDQPQAATPDFHGVHRARQIACAVELYQSMEIARDDRVGRQAAFLRNFELFDAPHIALVCMPREFGKQVALDVGCWLMTFLLALEAEGVQSCAQAALRSFPEVVASELSLPPELELMCGVAFGYERPSVPANRARQTRASLTESVVWLDD